MQSNAEGPRHAVDELAEIEYVTGSSILLFGNDAERRNRIGTAVEAAGGRVSAALDLAHAVQRISEHAAPDGVVIAFEDEDAALAEELLDALEQGARGQRFTSIALIGPDLIDLAAARAPHGDITLLCEADSHDVAAALGRLVSRRGTLLHDISADSAPVKLRELSEQVVRIARTLEALSGRENAERRLISGEGEEGEPRLSRVEAPTIRAMIRARRVREQFFGGEIFADPAWDMLKRVRENSIFPNSINRYIETIFDKPTPFPCSAVFESRC